MQQIHQHIQATLKDIYRKALDADKTLDALQQANQGKFVSVFAQDAGFATRAKRFLPYVEELSTQFQELQAASEEQQKNLLPDFVSKLELILKTLATFKSAK